MVFFFYVTFGNFSDTFGVFRPHRTTSNFLDQLFCCVYLHMHYYVKLLVHMGIDVSEESSECVCSGKIDQRPQYNNLDMGYFLERSL